MVRLYINGVARKVIIDDRLPVDRYGQWLCSHSDNADELWVSLLEKAYLKVQIIRSFHFSFQLLLAGYGRLRFPRQQLEY